MLTIYRADGTVKGQIAEGLVSDTVEGYLDGNIKPISLASDGRLRVITAEESYNFSAWSDPEQFGTNMPDNPTLSPWG